MRFISFAPNIGPAAAVPRLSNVAQHCICAQPVPGQLSYSGYATGEIKMWEGCTERSRNGRQRREDMIT